LVAGPNPAVLEEFIGRMIGDLGATVSAGLVVIGDRLGLYKPDFYQLRGARS
jgi:hypothetical protein